MGSLWNIGVNQAADAVVLTEDGYVLLIKRGDTGEWAFPGGFADGNDVSTEYTAFREALEEANVILGTKGQLLFSGRVEDHRNEEDRWVETDAYLFIVPERTPVKGGDDALKAMWYDVEVAGAKIQETHLPIYEALISWIRA